MQKRLYTFLLLLCLTFPAFRANAQTPASSFGIVVGYSTSTYQFDNTVVYPGSSSEFLWHGEYSKDNWNIGINLTRGISGHWQLKLGAQLTTSGYEQEINMGSIELGDGTFASLPADKLSVNHAFLEVPVLARYMLWDKKWSPYLEAGISTNYYLATRVRESLATRRRFWGERDLVNPINLAADVTAGCQIRSGKRNSWFFQLRGRRQLIRVEKDARNASFDVGMETGWRMVLKG